MSKRTELNRRDFLRAAGSGLVVGAALTTVQGCAGPFDRVRSAGTSVWGKDPDQKPETLFDIWLKISVDNTVTVFVPSSELGQGVSTSLPMLIAEELDADWKSIRMEMSPAHTDYRKKYHYGSFHMTAESRSVRESWIRLRQAGAAARSMLVEAAAARWGVTPEQCKTENGSVFHPDGKTALPYGALADEAAHFSAPSDPPLKDPKDFKLIGKSIPRVDLPAKVNGSAVYGVDVKVPGMVYAAIRICPVFGGSLKSVNRKSIEGMPGVEAVVELDDAVAVVANSWWRAQQAVSKLDVVFDEGEHADFNDAGVEAMLNAGLEDSGPETYGCGDIDDAIEEASTVLDQVYSVPYIQHATLEPMNCTAHVQEDRIDLWIPTQSQEWTEDKVTSVSGMSRSKIFIHTTLVGGGLGRRLESDFAAQAVLISEAVGKPVKLIWNREQDTQHGFYRPAFKGRLQAAIDEKGNLTGLSVHNSGQFILQNYAPGFIIDIARRFPSWLNQDLDALAQQGAIEQGYDIANQSISYTRTICPVPIGNHRSVGHSYNAFFMESMLDEVAHATKSNPLAMRKKLLAHSPRQVAVLNKLEQISGFGKPPEGRSQGISFHTAFGSMSGQVAEVSVDDKGTLKVHKVYCVVDCGPVVHPDTVVSQLEGGIAFALSNMLGEEINIEKGRVRQSNFHDYPILKLSDMPDVEVAIMDNPGVHPGGIGEVGVPPLIPAVTNAIFAATGYRVRSMPLSKHKLPGKA